MATKLFPVDLGSATRMMFIFAWLLSGVVGCGEPKTVIPTGEFTEEQKAAIKAQDQKIADEESHGAKRR